MEIQTLDESLPAAIDHHSNVDTSRPFRSVKEAVAIFGEKFLAGEIHAPKPNFAFPKQETPCYYTPSPSPQQSQETSWKSIDSNDPILMESLKKLEAELEETKMELKLLKDRESETEVALASLNAELHKNMSKLAQAEAAAAAKAVLASRSVVPERSDRENGLMEDERRRDMIVRLETSPTLSQVLNAGEKEGTLFGSRLQKERKVTKKEAYYSSGGRLIFKEKGIFYYYA